MCCGTGAPKDLVRLRPDSRVSSAACRSARCLNPRFVRAPQGDPHRSRAITSSSSFQTLLSMDSVPAGVRAEAVRAIAHEATGARTGARALARIPIEDPECST